MGKVSTQVSQVLLSSAGGFGACGRLCVTLDSAAISTRPRTWLQPEREFFKVNLLVRIHFIIVMIRWTGLALLGCNHVLPN